MHQQEITLNGKKLSYRLTGEGPAVLLLHGFGEDGTVWEEQYQSIRGFRFLVPDLPGTGASEFIADMSMEGMASVIHELTVQLKMDKLILIGHSMGGYVSLPFAARYPEKLRGLGLFHSTAYADTEEKKATRRKGIDFIRNNGAFEFLKTTIPNLYGPASKEKNSALMERHIAASKSFTEESLVRYYESMIARPDRTEVLKQTDLPVLFVLGKHDTAVPLKDGLEQCYLPSLSEVHILEDSGHMGMKEEPAKASGLLNAFFKSCSS